MVIVEEILDLIRNGALKMQLNQLLEAIRMQRGPGAIKSAAHSIKGAAQGACFEILASLAAELEGLDTYDTTTVIGFGEKIKQEIYMLEQQICQR